ncbi:MAG: gephyrin-like molybdotransferase Glp [Candidatus Korobacteraceae bacterium]
MPTYEQARRMILENITPLGPEVVPVIDSLGRVIAEDIVAPWDLPLCENSAMDGYAVRAADCGQATGLRVTGYVPAGSLASVPVQGGCAIKIMTGAPVPSGADTVVPVEEIEERDGEIWINGPVRQRQHIRFTGEDVRCGETVISCGTVLRAAEISMMASCGRAAVAVHRKPRVAILSTGDELIGVGEIPVPGKVVDSNGLSLAAAVQECGALPVILGIARDTRASHLEKMTQGLTMDALITSAGVSAGERDLVREVLAGFGVRELFSRVEMSPGAPTTFGLRDRQPIFSLPGNPVASLIVFEEFVKPALLRLMGHRRVIKPFLRAILQDPVRKKSGKVKFLRVRLEWRDGKALAFSAGDQNTGMLKTMLKADGIAVLAAERTSFSPGDEIDVHLISATSEMLEP